MLEHLETAGPTLIWLVVLSFVFLECAVIIGLFLPGDSLLITAGMLFASGGATQPHLQIWALSGGAMLAAVAGNQVGYLLGKHTGHKLVARKDGKYLNARNLQHVADMLHKHGFVAVLVSRWIPWVRTLCPMVSGAAGMDLRRYTMASTLGAIIWAPVLLLVGFYAGSWLEQIPWLLPGALTVMVVGVLLGTVLGIRHYRQEIRKPAEEFHLDESDQLADTRQAASNSIHPLS